MALKVHTLNGVNIYNLTSGKTMPQWVATKNRRNGGEADDAFRRRVELLQDLDFPTSSQRVRVSRDGNYVVATGTYKIRD